MTAICPPDSRLRPGDQPGTLRASLPGALRRIGRPARPRPRRGGCAGHADGGCQQPAGYRACGSTRGMLPRMSRTQRLVTVLVLNLVLVAGLVAAGVGAHSLAVLAAGGDCLLDAAAVG